MKNLTPIQIIYKNRLVYLDNRSQVHINGMNIPLEDLKGSLKDTLLTIIQDLNHDNLKQSTEI